MTHSILIHGLGQNSTSWNKTISFMPKLANTTCPDLLTILHNKETNYTNLYKGFSDYCNDISGTLNLCGLSLGAILALNYALEHPEKVQSIVLIGAQYKMPKTLLKFQNIIFHFMPKTAFMTIGFEKKDFIKLTNSMIDLDFSQRLKDITCNTLIICGEKDSANKKAAKSLFNSIPNAKFHILKNTGHEVNVEAPEKLASFLWDFYLNTNQLM